MNWYKQALNPETFQDKNFLNEKARKLRDMANKLPRIAEIAFQDKIAARKMSRAIMEDKVLSSHPSIQDILAEADRICLDNPWKFGSFCKQAQEKLDQLTKQVESDISRFLINRKNILRQKGWWVKDE